MRYHTLILILSFLPLEWHYLVYNLKVFIFSGPWAVYIINAPYFITINML